MSAATAGLVRWGALARTTLRQGTVLFLLLMMVAMVGGALVYFLAPGTGGLVAGLWVASALMSLSVLVIFAAFLREVRRQEAGAASGPVGPGASFVAAVLGLALTNEFLMGWTFSLAAGGLPVAAPGGPVGVFAAVVASPWFLFTMSAEMLLTAYLLRDHLPTPVVTVLAFQAVIMVLSPPALATGWWSDVAIYGGSSVMIVLFVYLMEFIYRHRQLTAAFSAYLVRLLAIYGAMMMGLYLWFAYGSVLLFSASVLVEMVVFFEAVLRSEPFSAGPAVPWQLRPNWAFAVLAGIFVSEVFMGALLDLQLEPSSYSGVFFTLPLSGPAGTVLYNAVYNGFWFLAGITGSTWFLAMMGVEMGALVYFKLRETNVLETRVRLLLMMGCYAGFAVFFPSIYYAAAFPHAPAQATVPVLGWSMGIGTAALATGVVVVVLLTYVITGAVAALFGRRAICSTFCTAALMYQGTAIDSMKSFNRSSPTARKYLSSRFSAAYSVTTGLVLGSLALASGASVLDAAGLWNVSVLGSDPTVFLFALYFGVVWYVMFVSIPYFGNYNCVSMGWCYTGTIAQAFQRIGFFKLKVHDRQVCRECTTLDCAKACPVGLVDMPGRLRQTGEFRSSKCCGVGDCVGVCPYNNLYVADVRHWVRDRLGLPRSPSPVRRLPMVPATSAPVAAGGPPVSTGPVGAARR
jgi:polyferredoxin